MTANRFPTSLPTARTPDPMAAPALRWGVMGTGWIVERFVRSVQRHTRQQVVAVSSRDHARAADAGRRLDVPRAFGSYEELAAHPEVDVVYVATGHTEHLRCARIAVEHGKHTLVEKPLALNASQASELARLAAVHDVFCAEALWSFYLPRYDVVRQLLDDGALGKVRTVLADHGEQLPPEHRIFRADQAGGPLLDLGTYPMSFATWVLGDAEVVTAAARPHPAGVHGQLGAVLANARGTQAVLHTSVFGDTPTTASVSGSLGTLTLPGPFYQPGDVLLTPVGGGQPLAATETRTGHDALFYEAAEVARCVDAGLTQTPLRPLADSIATLWAMDGVRARCGIAFPGETSPGNLASQTLPGDIPGDNPDEMEPS